MQLTGSTISLTVDDAAISSRFFTIHFGFVERMAFDGFARLEREDLGMDIVFVQRGTAMLAEDHRDQHVAGLAITFIVGDIEEHEARLRAAGVTFVMPVHPGRWGERLLQVLDPNAITVRLVDWTTGNKNHQPRSGAPAGIARGDMVAPVFIVTSCGRLRCHEVPAERVLSRPPTRFGRS